MPKLADENDLQRRAAGGDQEALAVVFDQYRQRLKQTLRLRMDRRLHGRLDASDVLQETFLDASRRLPEYVAAPKVSLFLWLRSLATQRLVDLHRHHFGVKMRSVCLEVSINTGVCLSVSAASMSEMLVDASKTPGAALVLVELQLRVQAALNAMDEIDREVLAMRHFEMLTNNEVADVLNLTKAAASNRYVRALRRLHEVLNG
jgi:RNA polymerase sigma-70 factor, ECF subfamily